MLLLLGVGAWVSLWAVSVARRQRATDEVRGQFIDAESRFDELANTWPDLAMVLEPEPAYGGRASTAAWRIRVLNKCFPLGRDPWGRPYEWRVKYGGEPVFRQQFSVHCLGPDADDPSDDVFFPPDG